MSDEEVKKYFEALASDNPDEMESVRSEVAEPGSLADAYALHFIHATNSNFDAGFPPEPSTLNDIDGGYEMCSTDEEGKETCTEFTEMESTNGKLADFAVGGNDLRDRISVGDGTKKSAGPLGSVEFLGSYLQVDGSLAVHARIKTKNLAITGPYTARYRSPEGRQSSTNSASAPEEIDPDSTAYVSFYFPRAKPGGRVTIPMADPDYTIERTVKFKTR